MPVEFYNFDSLFLIHLLRLCPDQAKLVVFLLIWHVHKGLLCMLWELTSLGKNVHNRSFQDNHISIPGFCWVVWVGPCLISSSLAKGCSFMDHSLSYGRDLHSSVKLWAMLCRATQDRQVIVKSSDKTWSTERGNGNLLQYSCMDSMKRQKDTKLENESPGLKVSNVIHGKCMLSHSFVSFS